MKKYFLAFLLLFTQITFAETIGQKTDSVIKLSSSSLVNSPPDSTEVPDKADKNTFNRSPFSSFEFLLSLFVLLFGLIVICLEVWLAKTGLIQSDHIFKCIIITLIITGSLLLITAGYTNNQITGITGILGSIAGYLLAKTTENNSNSNQNKKDEKD